MTKYGNLGSDSSALFARAQRTIPGGVNSPVRSFRAIGGTPRFIKRAQGAYLFDEDGCGYVDLICSWGAMVLGHGDEEIANLVHAAAADGLSYGAPTLLEVEMAEELCRAIPSMEQVRVVNSGTEATMSAVRLARGWRDRAEIVKFNGCYHGHSDCLLVKAGSGVLSLPRASSAGVPQELIQHTHNLAFNDCQQVEDYFKQRGEKTAAVIVEPMAGNMNFVPADTDFLRTLRRLCDDHGALLIFDEVMTGFRVAAHSAQIYYDIRPDLTCLGKIIGGGMPIGAFGGRRDVMQHLAPQGEVYQAGTLSGNPLVMTLGLHTIRTLAANDAHSLLEQASSQLVAGINRLAQEFGVPLCAQGIGGMWGLYCGVVSPPRDFAEMQQTDGKLFARFFHQLLQEGVHLPPSAFEACFVSLAHKREEVEKILHAVERSLRVLTAT